jgi:hypothetical protein
MVFSEFLRLLLAGSGRHLLADNPFPFLFKHIRTALEKEHAEDEIFVEGGIHLAAQDVGSGIEVAFELREG